MIGRQAIHSQAKMVDAQAAEIAGLVEQLSRRLLAKGLSIATVESCTGGMVASVFTDVAGSSRWFDRGFVSYTNQAKSDMVGVRPETISHHGAVSEAVAVEMAEGGVSCSEAACALSITGIAGPGGGTVEKPVGMVCFAWAGFTTETAVKTKHFQGTRMEIRLQSVVYAIRNAIRLIE